MLPHNESGCTCGVPQLEYEKGPDDDSSEEVGPRATREESPPDTKLVVVFVLMVLFGAGNTVFGKLQAVPMYNYPNFLNIFSLILYLPITFAYILPAAKYGWFENSITPEQLALPKRPFCIMGCLDCITGLMQVFSSVYLPGPLLVLLPQAAIPISMIFSRYLLGKNYRSFQYVGATIVIIGILVVLEPMMTHRHAPDFLCQAIDEDRDCTICQVEVTQENCLSHRLDNVPDFMFNMQQQSLWDNSTNDDDEGQPICQWISASSASSGQELFLLIWSAILILSCVPMTLSSIYKEISLADQELDPVFMNGWIALYQLLFSLLLAVPAGMASSPPVFPADLPRNLWDGFLCYLGIGSIDTGCHPDSMCASHATLLVNIELIINLGYSLIMIYMLKYGSANLLFLALTVMVPLGNLAFTLPIMPQQTTFHLSDVLGLGVIMVGLVLYRFADTREKDHVCCPEAPVLLQLEEEEEPQEVQLRRPLLSGDV